MDPMDVGKTQVTGHMSVPSRGALCVPPLVGRSAARPPPRLLSLATPRGTTPCQSDHFLMLEIGDLQSPGATARSYRHALAVGARVDDEVPMSRPLRVRPPSLVPGRLGNVVHHPQLWTPLQEETVAELRTSRLGVKTRCPQ